MENEVAVMKASQELEELYLGVKDSSVDLTFKHLAILKEEQEQDQAQEKKKDIAVEPMHEEKEDENLKKKSTIISKSPSLDFSKVLQQEAENNNNKGGIKGVKENSQVHDDVNGYPLEEEQEGEKRQGIPHTSICALCNVYVRFFRHRCLVCGRVYCRKCVVKGMGAMTEGRKCRDCLGKDFPKGIFRGQGIQVVAVDIQDQLSNKSSSGQRRGRDGPTGNIRWHQE